MQEAIAHTCWRQDPQHWDLSSAPTCPQCRHRAFECGHSEATIEEEAARIKSALSAINGGKLDRTIKVRNSGAYIELYERDGGPGARMSFFDGDYFHSLEELRGYADALNQAIEILAEQKGENK